MPKPHDPAPAPVVTRSVEEWQAERQTPEWVHRAAFVANHWCIGLTMPASDYDAAIHAAQHGAIR